MMMQACTLTAADLAWLDEHVGALPGAWTLETVEEPQEVSAVLLPGQGDRFAATYLIERVADGYRLMACRWDAMTPAGVFPTLAATFAPITASAEAAMRAAPFPNLQ